MEPKHQKRFVIKNQLSDEEMDVVDRENPEHNKSTLLLYRRGKGQHLSVGNAFLIFCIGPQVVGETR